MLPREHGAYGQLLFPLLTPLAIGGASAVALLLIGASVCAFLAHEPLLVLAGHRGARASREDRARAWRWFAPLAAAAALLGLAAIAVAARDVRVALAVPAVLGVALAVVIAAGREHTVAGEVLTAAALASLAAPVALAAGVEAKAAITCAAAFGGGFVAATGAVHAVIRRTRNPPATWPRVAAGTAAVAIVALLAALSAVGVLRPAAQWGALPLAFAGLALVAAPPSARHLKRVGWTLVAATVSSSLVLIVSLR